MSRAGIEQATLGLKSSHVGGDKLQQTEGACKMMASTVRAPAWRGPEAAPREDTRIGSVRNDPFDLQSRRPVIGRVVTATITLVCVLIVYDGWAALDLWDVVLIVVGPVIAIFTAHIFSSSLVQQVELGRRPTLREWLETARFESRFLLLAVPPLGVLLVLRIANVSLTDSVQVVIWLEALSLSFWAGLAAWYAGLRGRSLALSLLGGLVVSTIVLLLQVFLQPGKAVDNGSVVPVHPAGASGRKEAISARRFSGQLATLCPGEPGCALVSIACPLWRLGQIPRLSRKSHSRRGDGASGRVDRDLFSVDREGGKAAVGLDHIEATAREAAPPSRIGILGRHVVLFDVGQQTIRAGRNLDLLME